MNNLQKIRLHRNTLMRTVLFYAVLASLWILLSDAVLGGIIRDPELLTRAQTFKGGLFVVVTALMLYFYLRRRLQILRRQEESFEAEQQQKRRDIEDQFNQLNMLFDSMQAVVYVAEIESHELLYVNRYAQELFGANWQGELCYRYLQHDIEQPCDFCTNAQLLTDGEPGDPVSWEFCNTRNQRWYECFDKAIRWTDGRLVRLEIALDITERKELEIIKDNILSSVSHEMRTPLTAICGFAELLLENHDLPEQVQKHLYTIFRESERMTGLIGDFLSAQRLKTDRSRVGYQPVRVEEVFQESVKRCCDVKPEHQIRFSGDASLEVLGNRQELTQAVGHLLSNACRYSPAGGVVEFSASQNEQKIELCVRDQGIGIALHEQEDIFKPFYRIDAGDTRSTSGVGIGLTLVKDIIVLHGGKVSVESTEGEGSRFCLTLPRPISYSKSQTDSAAASQES
ncbi:MAG: PAS domain-containing sensor histidine kinase [Desulfuromonadales bacterium]|nr:PAS domain-containing sensor histidine kinase [Desulfuromonadales bacterium]